MRRTRPRVDRAVFSSERRALRTPGAPGTRNGPPLAQFNTNRGPRAPSSSAKTAAARRAGRDLPLRAGPADTGGDPRRCRLVILQPPPP